ncbi:YciI family protein [Lysobacter enzymogenes]|uniref:YciI family protein n=1 Tax=Lysobacter enzymogenes TaxID=69 RepID=UPI001A96FFBF|nr:YciI family protein [Lysobacter enzymogenes]QQP95091.1 YciI family protein [Lysobacter enzymogenes]
MKFMLIVKATADSEAGVMPSTELLTAMGAYNEELVRAGVLLAGEGLHPSARGARVHFDGRARRVAPGPFQAPGELIAGFWLIQARSLEEAVEWVKRVPNPDGSQSQIEIRQVFDAADFGDALTPELQAAEAQLREQVAGRH